MDSGVAVGCSIDIRMWRILRGCNVRIFQNSTEQFRF